MGRSLYFIPRFVIVFAVIMLARSTAAAAQGTAERRFNPVGLVMYAPTFDRVFGGLRLETTRSTTVWRPGAELLVGGNVLVELGMGLIAGGSKKGGRAPAPYGGIDFGVFFSDQGREEAFARAGIGVEVPGAAGALRIEARGYLIHDALGESLSFMLGGGIRLR